MHGAYAFAEEWIAAWNARDLERILAHYADEVELRSPRARELVPESGGVIRGKAALRAYWAMALEASEALHFDLVAVFASIDGGTILYDNHRGQRVSETFAWNRHGLVERASVAYQVSRRPFVHCMVARVPEPGRELFRRYEAGVLPMLREHGGSLARRLRSADGEVEVHLVEVAQEEMLIAYRSDPRRVALQPLLAESGAHVEGWAMSDVDD